MYWKEIRLQFSLTLLWNGRKFKGDLNQFENGLEFLNHIMNYEIKPSVTYQNRGKNGKTRRG